MSKFRECFQLDDEGEEMPLVDNYRPPQPLRGREIYSSFQPVDTTSSQQEASALGGATIVKSSIVFVFCMFVMLFV